MLHIWMLRASLAILLATASLRSAYAEEPAPVGHSASPPVDTAAPAQDDISNFLAAASDLEVRNRSWITARIEGINEAQALQDATTALDHDVRGLVATLVDDDVHADHLANYLRALLRADGGAHTAGQQLATLQGADSGLTAIDFFDQHVEGVDGAPRYENAESLGYYVGALVRALRASKLSAEAARKMVATILHTSNELLFPADAAKQMHSTLDALINAGLADSAYGDDGPFLLLQTMALPRLPDGKRYRGDSVTYADQKIQLIGDRSGKMD